jgi:hypothetical protein
VAAVLLHDAAYHAVLHRRFLAGLVNHKTYLVVTMLFNDAAYHAVVHMHKDRIRSQAWYSSKPHLVAAVLLHDAAYHAVLHKHTLAGLAPPTPIKW